MPTHTHEDEDRLTVYEVGYHLVPTLDDDKRALRVQELKELITREGGEIRFEGAPVPVALAYTMRKRVGGRYIPYDHSYFGWIKFRAAPATAHAIKEALRSFPDLIRTIVIKTIDADFTPTTPKGLKPRRRGAALGVGSTGAAQGQEVSEEEVARAVDAFLGDDDVPEEGGTEHHATNVTTGADASAPPGSEEEGAHTTPGEGENEEDDKQNQQSAEDTSRT